jgi:hypothetical protein
VAALKTDLDAGVILTSAYQATLVAAVWAAAARTLTSFGTLTTDSATAVWASVTRTLSAFAFSVTVGTNNDKTGYALTSGEHVGIATDAQTGLTAQGYTATRAGYLDTLNGLVAAVWAAATRTLSAFGFTVTTDVSGTVTTNLNAPISGIPNANANADALLKRDWSAISGEAAHSVLQALRGLGTCNKVVVDYTGGTISIFKEDGTTLSHTIPIVTAPNITQTITQAGP